MYRSPGLRIARTAIHSHSEGGAVRMYRSPSPGPSFAVRVYRSPSKAKARTAIHSHGPSLAVRVYRSPGTSKFKNRALFAHPSTRSSSEVVVNSGTPDFCNRSPAAV